MLQDNSIRSGVDRPLFEGYLTKQGIYRKKWTRYWFIIGERGIIRYYKPNGLCKSIPRGTIDIAQNINSTLSAIEAGNHNATCEDTLVEDEDLDTATSWPSCVPNRHCRFAIRGLYRTHYFYADDAAQSEKWKNQIEKLIENIRTNFSVEV